MAISLLYPLSGLPFIITDVTTFFVSTMQMVHLILAHSLLLDINKSLMSVLPFIFLHMTVTPYSLINILLSNNLLVSEMCLMPINDNVVSIFSLHLIC